MRELEFLPEWYPMSRRRKRFVLLQGYMTMLLAGGLMVWWLLAQRNVHTAAGALAGIQTQLSQTHQEMHQLEEQVALKNQLLVQRQISQKLGLPVEMARLLSELDQNLPGEMSLTDLSFDTQEQLKVVNTIAAARNATQGDNVDRRLHIRLDGIAPTDEEIANFLTSLARIPFFENVAMNYSRDHTDNGKVMRDFEVTFSIDLNQQAGN